MTVPTLTVVGRAERDVVPDRVVVSVAVRTPMLPSPQQALGRCAEARRRLLDHLRDAHPTSTIADGRITTLAEQRRVKVEDELDGSTEERWEIDGYTGHCLVTLEDDAAAAAAIVASAGTHPDAERVSPAFVVSRDLARRTAVDLEQEAVRDALDRAEGLAARRAWPSGRSSRSASRVRRRRSATTRPSSPVDVGGRGRGGAGRAAPRARDAKRPGHREGGARRGELRRVPKGLPGRRVDLSRPVLRG